MSDNSSSCSPSWDESLTDLILSFEHTMEFIPETPKLSPQTVHPFQMEVETLGEDFCLDEISGGQFLPLEEPLDLESSKPKPRRLITKRKSQNARRIGKFSL